MTKNKTEKSNTLHPRSPHQGRYDFTALTKACPELKQHLIPNKAGDKSIDFFSSSAVLCLNKAILAHHYKVLNWNIPKNYLCPAIPGRADYIHYLADLLKEAAQDILPTGKQINVLDVGTGANCIYPIIGSQSYGWQFLGVDTNPVSIKSAEEIIKSNDCLKDLIQVKLQEDKGSILKNILTKKFDLTLCNPPFYTSVEKAEASNQRKIKKLSKGTLGVHESKFNCSGHSSELACTGGEFTFIKRMAKESVCFAKEVYWFTSLVSNGENIPPLEKLIIKLGAKNIKVIDMSQGQKKSRFIAWSFLTPEECKNWKQTRWNLQQS